MNTPTRVAAFAAGLAVVFAGATGVGRAVGPVDTRAEPGPDARQHAVGPTGQNAVTEAPKGLQVSEGGYSLRLPEPTLPEGPWTLSLTVLGPNGRPVTAYQNTHEKELHLVVVQRDLSGYRHLHPVRNGAGVWTTPVDLFPGTYRVFADFRPADQAEDLTLGIDLIVSGSIHPGLLPAPFRTEYVDDYEVTLDGGLAPATVSRLTLTIRRGGRVLTDLQRYFGGPGHLVVLRAGDLAYLDVREDGDALAFDVAVPSPGTYRLYFDFTHRDTVRTAEFTAVTVTGATTPAPAAATGGGHGD